MSTKDSVAVRFAGDSEASSRSGLRQRPHTAAVTAEMAAAAAASASAPFLDARGNRTQPSRDGPSSAMSGTSASTTDPAKKKRRRRRSGRPKTAIGIEQHGGGHNTATAPGSAGTPGAGGHEPNFPTLNPRVFHALRGFLTPESLRKTKFYSDREDRMVARREQLDAQQERLNARIGGFYQRLDSFIAETNAAAEWEPEDKRKQKSLLDDLGNL